MLLLQARHDRRIATAKAAGMAPPGPCHVFNSFFVEKLLERGMYTYKNVRRWTRKVRDARGWRVRCLCAGGLTGDVAKSD